MKTVLRIAGWLGLIAVLVVAGAMLYSTWKGCTTWYFRVNGQVMVDGLTTTGYMHANTGRTILLLTRTDGIRPETYLISLGDQKSIYDCGDWHPTRFLPFPMTHANPPCSIVHADAAKTVDVPVAKTLAMGRRSVQFSTAAGKNVKAEW